jgi:2-dehydro-3-deoxyphosphogluconate aldolase/(4S)-4-hydroxy-2-oxoglutarate aldolase
MARFKRLATLNAIIEGGLVPVFYQPDIDKAKRIVDAVAKGGCRVIEMTNRGDRAWRVFEALEIHCAKELPEMVLGVGSIVDAPTASLYIASGANFVVGPTLSEETARLCNARKVPYSPGCGSATEIQRAHELGVEIVKVFPGGEVGGPAFVKAVLGPCPWTSIMPTGGVDTTEQSTSSWIKAGAVALGIGSKLITKELVAAGDFDGIAKKVRQVLDWVKAARS